MNLSTTHGLAWAALLTATASALQEDFLSVYGISDDLDLVGDELCGVGDLDADGVPDFASRAYQFGVGRVMVYSGKNGAVILSFLGDTNSTNALGVTLDSADLDLDGLQDLLVGDPFHSEVAGVGCVWAISGADGSRIWQAFGSGGWFGREVAVIGDLDQDGSPEVLIGAPADTSGPGKGRVEVCSGATGQTILSIPATQGLSGFGQFVSAAGDANADGKPDYAVHTIHSTGGFSNSGRVRVYAGGGGILHDFSGDSDDERLGCSMAAVGDIDGDGHDDLLVGAFGDDLAGVGSGSAFVISGDTGGVLRTHLGGAPDQGFGTWVSGVGDVDGDGMEDYGITAPLDDGTGTDSGSVWIYSGATGSLIDHVTGDGPGLAWGEGLAGIGDVDGDGLEDWVAGAPTDHVAHELGGYARVRVAACAGGWYRYCVTTPNSAGPGATIAAQGSTSVSANDLVLTVTGGVGSQFGFFFYGPLTQQTPAGDGQLCVHPGLLKLFRLVPPVLLDGAGDVARPVDYGTPPMNGGQGAVAAGDTWYFQFMYRDPAAGGSGFNFSDGIGVRFCD